MYEENEIDARPHSKVDASVAAVTIAAISESFTLFNFTGAIVMSASLDSARPEKQTLKL
jgi:hypothetical protein